MNKWIILFFMIAATSFGRGGRGTEVEAPVLPTDAVRLIDLHDSNSVLIATFSTADSVVLSKTQKRPKNILICGDSNSDGTAAAFTPNPRWIDSLASFVGTNTTVLSNGLSGWSLLNMTTGLVNFTNYPSADSYDLCVIFGGINDIGSGQTGAQAFGRFTNLVVAALADGWDDILAITYYGWDGLETETSIFNGLVSSFCNSNGYRIVDHASIVNDANGNILDKYVWQGNLHLNQAAADVLSEMVYSSIFGGNPCWDKTDRAGLPSNYYILEGEGVYWGPISGGGVLGGSVVPRVAGITNSTYYVIFNGAYAGIGMIASGHCGRVTGSGYAGDIIVTGTGSVTSTNFPLAGALPGDDYVFGFSENSSLTPGVGVPSKFEPGIPLLKINFSNTASFDAAHMELFVSGRINGSAAEAQTVNGTWRKGGAYTSFFAATGGGVTYEGQHLALTEISGSAFDSTPSVGAMAWDGFWALINTSTNAMVEHINYHWKANLTDYRLTISDKFLTTKQ